MTIRCRVCRKKLVIEFNCRCDGKFCAKHRQPERHECTALDKFKEEGRKEMERKSVVVVNDKITRI